MKWCGTCPYGGVNMELRCRGDEREMEVSLLMRLCGTINWSPKDTTRLFHSVLFTYLLATIVQSVLVEVEHSSTHLVWCIWCLIIRNNPNEYWLIAIEMSESTVMWLNFEYMIIHASMKQYGTEVKHCCLSSLYHSLIQIPSSTIQFDISKHYQLEWLRFIVMQW